MGYFEGRVAARRFRRSLADDQTTKLAETFGVAAESAQSFGRWHTGLRFAKDICTVGVGLATLAGTGGAAVPALGAAFGTSVVGHALINRLLPLAFPKTESFSPKPNA